MYPWLPALKQTHCLSHCALPQLKLAACAGWTLQPSKLQQLNKEIAALDPKVEAAFEVYNTARAATTRARVALAGPLATTCFSCLLTRLKESAIGPGAL